MVNGRLERERERDGGAEEKRRLAEEGRDEEKDGIYSDGDGK